MATRWRLRPFDSAQIQSLSRGARVSPLVAQLLINRGITDPQQAVAFMQAKLSELNDPETLPGVTEAAERVVRAIRADRPIVIYGDYDVDGVCGTSVLWACLRLAGARQVHYYIPHRVEEGYGVNGEALVKLAQAHRNALVITVDCGISAVAEAARARELGLELIVTDHHTIGHDLPGADVLVHPRLPGSTYPCGDLCGAAVAFKLAWQICKSFGDGKKASPHLRDFLVRSLGLVAMATVADVVPLTSENRIIVRHGLAGIAAAPMVGLKALMAVTGSLDKSKLTTGTVAFGLAPRINAAGRLERAMRAVEMLTTEDADLAAVIAGELNELNAKRQEVERSIVQEAQEMVRSAGGSTGKGAIVVGKRGWHPGVIGIVASRLVEFYHRPTIVVALGDEVCQGSARSIPGFNLYEAIRECSDGLIAFGGHAAAAGLKMTQDHFPTFAERFNAHCQGVLTTEQLEKSITVDAEVQLSQLTLATVEDIERLEPHGMGNPRPLLLASQVRVAGEPRVVGAQRNHLQLRFLQGNFQIKAIGWGLAEKARELTPNAVCSIVFHSSINEWNGRREVQLELRDVNVEAAAASAPERMATAPASA
ncbi:single-stranded-DNA-specific exonuclease RecJ [Aquisphaera insulae]|uniref:single-stranded-DNA-specific exonuclease RecJ n=1 Tax=Aquisphaera insulae TaxID=2712864 RepID=UPI0013ED4CD8|nr:single-stranded-DNA-specific exonuclease RecJ [Aquisphaera insulae]